MAGIPSSNLIAFKGWPLGVDNVTPEESAAPDRLRAGVNVELDDAGKPRLRQGRTLIDARSNLHSLFAHDRYPWMVGVHADALIGFDSDLNVTVLHAGLSGGGPMSYDVAAGWLFYSNGVDCGAVDLNGHRRDWSPEQPAGQPIVTPHASAGGLRAGVYQVAVTFIDEYGRESGSTLSIEVELAEGQGIQLTGMPIASDPSTRYLRVYVSQPNGDVLYAAQDIPVGLNTFLLGAHRPGKALETQFLSPVPPGSIVRVQNGVLHVVNGRLHRYCETLHYGLTKLHEYYVRFDADITLLEPAGEAAEAGLFIAAGMRTYYFSGNNPKTWQRVIAHTHGAVLGTSQQVNAVELGFSIKGTIPLWLTTNGNFVVGLPGGIVTPLHLGRYVAPEFIEAGAVAMRNFKGINQLVASLRGGVANVAGTKDQVEAEVWRNGVRIS